MYLGPAPLFCEKIMLVVFSSAKKVLICPVDSFGGAVDGGLFWGWKDYDCCKVDGPVLVENGRVSVVVVKGSYSGGSQSVEDGLGI